MASRLTDEEATALRFALTSSALVPMERLELLDFLGYPEEMPSGTKARVVAVVERILELRGYDPIEEG